MSNRLLNSLRRRNYAQLEERGLLKAPDFEVGEAGRLYAEMVLDPGDQDQLSFSPGSVAYIPDGVGDKRFPIRTSGRKQLSGAFSGGIIQSMPEHVTGAPAPTPGLRITTGNVDPIAGANCTAVDNQTCDEASSMVGLVDSNTYLRRSAVFLNIKASSSPDDTAGVLQAYDSSVPCYYTGSSATAVNTTATVLGCKVGPQYTVAQGISLRGHITENGLKWYLYQDVECGATYYAGAGTALELGGNIPTIAFSGIKASATVLSISWTSYYEVRAMNPLCIPYGTVPCEKNFTALMDWLNSMPMTATGNSFKGIMSTVLSGLWRVTKLVAPQVVSAMTGGIVPAELVTRGGQAIASFVRPRRQPPRKTKPPAPKAAPQAPVVVVTNQARPQRIRARRARLATKVAMRSLPFTS